MVMVARLQFYLFLVHVSPGLGAINRVASSDSSSASAEGISLYQMKVAGNAPRGAPQHFEDPPVNVKITSGMPGTEQFASSVSARPLTLLFSRIYDHIDHIYYHVRYIKLLSIRILLMFLWILITASTCFLLSLVHSHSSKQQGTLLQRLFIKAYTVTAILLIPSIVALIFPLHLVALLACTSAGCLLCFESLPHLLGLGKVLNYAVSTCWNPPASLCTQCGALLEDHVGPCRFGLCLLIAAQLSNETATLPETLRQFLPEEEGGRGIRLPEGTLIVISYNPGPVNRQESQCLEHCEAIGSKIPGATYISVCIPDATCKADNLNGALSFLAKQHEHQPELRPQVVCLMDADVQFQDKYSVELGMSSLQDSPPEVAVVTGRQGISQGHWLVAIEFQVKNVVILGRGTFLGCGGWLTGMCAFVRFNALADNAFDRRCLTEDNDFMMRLAAAGFQCKNDMNVKIHTEAPPGFIPFLTQRTRWAQGHVWIALMRIPNLLVEMFSQQSTSRAWKMCTAVRWIIFWFGRPFGAYLVPLGLPCALAFQFRCDLRIFGEESATCYEAQKIFGCWAYLFMAYSAVNFTVLFAAFLFPHPWLRWYHFIFEAFFRVPYDIFNAQAPIIGHAQFILGLNRWIVTDRQHREEIQHLKCLDPPSQPESEPDCKHVSQ